MTDNSWIVLIVVAGLVVGLALWRGRGLQIKKDEKGFSIEASEAQPGESQQGAISVGENLEIENADVGDIAGIKEKGVGADSGPPGKIDVLRGGTIKGGTIGDITGIKREGEEEEELD